MFTLSREADYAVRVMVHMASDVEERFQSKTLAKDENIPESFLFKILQTLIRHGVVRSYRGVGGGYQLAIDPARLSLYRLLEMVEGPLELNLCVVSGTGCEFTEQCGVHDVWEAAQAQLRKTLEEVSLEELARIAQRKKNGLASIGSGFELLGSRETRPQ
jgi:Rrf2 family transcriptional regulator, iron-sulfur cluster assembly transcription factor